ncbi:MAG: hypothetical protein Q8K36_03710, partial [Alphaproteobacteria bacterium]|nr:hypothetical protein [Alphaproteobacteria bacterium]
MMKLPKLLLTSCILMNAYASDTGRPAAVSGRHLQPHTRPATTIAETRPQATILPKTLPEALQALAESQEENQKLRLRIQELEALLAQTTLKQAPLQDAPPPAAAAAAKCTLHGLSPKELDVLTQAKTIEIGTPERTAAAQRLKEIFTTPKHQANLKQYLDAVDKNIDQHSPSEVKCAQVLAMQYIFMTTIAPLVYADHTMVFFNENQIKKNQPPFYTFLKEFMTDANKSFEELKKGYPKLFHFFANQAGFEGKNIEPCFIQNELITKAVEEENKTTKKMETVSSGELSLAETCTDKKPILLELLT